MRTHQASVRSHDAIARMMQKPLSAVRYDLSNSSAAFFNSFSGQTPSPGLVSLGRKWLGRIYGLAGQDLLIIEERIDSAIVGQLEEGIPTTCGGFIVS